MGTVALSGALATSGSNDCETTLPGAEDPRRYLPTVGGTVGGGVVGGAVVGGGVVGGGVVAGWVVAGAGVVGGAGVEGGDDDGVGGRGAAVVATGVGDVGLRLIGTV